MKAYVVEREHLAQNIRAIREEAGESIVWAVLKGNGYGLGVVQMAELMRENGIDHFAVTEAREARLLREAGFEESPILMLRQTMEPELIHELLDLQVIFTVGSSAAAEALDAMAAERSAMAEVHLKIDTGMGRYGFKPEELPALLEVYACRKNIVVGGIYTHFNCAFCDDKRTQKQYTAFRRVVMAIGEAGFEVGMVHCCNSAAFLKFPQMRSDAVRIGSAFLGRLSFQDGLGLKRIGHARGDDRGAAPAAAGRYRRLRRRLEEGQAADEDRGAQHRLVPRLFRCRKGAGPVPHPRLHPGDFAQSPLDLYRQAAARARQWGAVQRPGPCGHGQYDRRCDGCGLQDRRCWPCCRSTRCRSRA